MKNKKKLNFFSKGVLLFLLTIIYLGVFSFISDDHTWILFLMQLFSLFISLYVVLKCSNYKFNLFLLFFPFICVMVVGMLVEKDGYIRALPYIILLPIIAVFGIYLVRKKSYYLLVFILFIIPLNSFLLFPNWLIYNVEKQRETIAIGSEIPALKFMENNGKLVNLSKEKIIVLDFWTTNCGVCFKKFPEFERIKKKYDGNPKIEFYSVNMPIKKDTFINTVQLMNKLDYSFKTIYAVDRVSVEKQLNFNSYPQVFIIKDNKIAYAGGLNAGEGIFVYNLESIIEKNM